MQTLERDTTVTGQRVETISPTRVVKEEALASSSRIDKEGWRIVINEPLIDWGRDPSQLEDEGIDAPSKSVIDFANQLALILRDEGSPAPNRVIPSGDGGIVFKWSTGNRLETLEIHADYSIEFIVFHGSEIITRQKIQ